MLHDRHEYLGASEAGAFLGLSKFATPQEVWLRKVMATPAIDADDDNVPGDLARGNAMEEMIVRELAKRGVSIASRQLELTHPQHKFLRCHLDGIIINPDKLAPGAVGPMVLEIKAPRMTTLRTMEYKGLTVDNVCQGYHQITVARANKLDVKGVMFVVWDYDNWCPVAIMLPIDEKVREDMIAELVKRWGHVERREAMPEQEASLPISELQAWFATTVTGDVDLKWEPPAINRDVLIGLLEDAAMAKKIFDEAEDQYFAIRDNLEQVVVERAIAKVVMQSPLEKVSYSRTIRAGRASVDGKGALVLLDTVRSLVENDNLDGLRKIMRNFTPEWFTSHGPSYPVSSLRITKKKGVDHVAGLD